MSTQIVVGGFISYAAIAGIIVFKMVNNKDLVSLIIPLHYKIGIAVLGFGILPWMLLTSAMQALGKIGQTKDEKTDPEFQRLNADISMNTSGLFIMMALIYGATSGLPLAYLVEHQNDKPADTSCVCKK